MAKTPTHVTRDAPRARPPHRAATRRPRDAPRPDETTPGVAPGARARPEAARPAPRTAHAPAPEAATLSLRVSASLRRQLETQAREEGLRLEEFAAELLTEGLVLRAWEILEGKAARRSGRSQGRPPAPSGPPRQRRGGGPPDRSRGHGANHRAKHPGSDGRDDQAAFMDSLRRQDR